MHVHEQFMAHALEEAELALSRNEFPVGCVIVNDGKIVAKGCRKNSKFFDDQQAANELDHAEIVALRELVSSKPDGDRTKTIVYSTMEPCLMCFSTLILNNIHTIVYAYEDVMGGGTNLPLHRLAPLYKQKQLTIVPHVLRSRSLHLFKRFFASPTNKYWQDSLLAQYTLDQKDLPE
jgi:tRNA(adenine34) deaminase